MSFAKKLNKRNIAIIENLIFVSALGFFLYYQLSIYGRQIFESIKGKGYFGKILNPILTHNYFLGVAAIIVLLNITVILWEILSLIIQLLKKERSNTTSGYHKYKPVFKEVAVHYKSSVLAMVVTVLIPKLLLLNIFWVWLPHFQKFQLFTVNLKWYSWIYGYLVWELSSWVWHFSCHRVRFLWCLHSPHHAPSELNLMVNWLHFFGERYYAIFIFLFLSTLLGFNTIMFIAIVSFDAAWGIFVHVSERAVRNGRLGILHHLIITPAHHRVHHSKNPLYLDRNYANVIPIWDWIFGTLQPLKDEVRPEYGISRDLDVTNFSDLYFGELLLLYQDVKNAKGIKNKLLYIFKPPGWSPVSTTKTATVLRQEFLTHNIALGMSNRQRFFTSIKSIFRRRMLNTKQMPGSKVNEMKIIHDY